MLVHRLWPAILTALTTVSCFEGSANFRARYEPGFADSKTTISVLGVFQSGRASHEAWAQIGPALSTAMGQPSCQVGYGEQLANANPDLLTTIDDSVRAEGITEEMLDRVAGAAEGDLVLVLSMDGRVGLARSGGQPEPGPGGRPPPPGRRFPARGEGAELRIGGTLFSVRQHKPVAKLDMNYSGPNLDEAIRRFVKRFSEMAPGSTCRGWHWESPQATPPTPPVF